MAPSVLTPNEANRLAPAGWNDGSRATVAKAGLEPSDSVQCSLYGSLSPELLGNFIEQLSEMCHQSMFGDKTDTFSDYVCVFWPESSSSGMGSKDSSSLRLTSEHRGFGQGERMALDAASGDWEIGYYGPPEHPRIGVKQSFLGLRKAASTRAIPSPQIISDPGSSGVEDLSEVNMRAVYTAPIVGDVFLFMELLGYKQEFEYSREGYRFFFQGIKIEIFRVCEPMDGRSLGACRDHFGQGKPWIIEASAITEAEAVPRVKSVMAGLAESLRSFTNLQAVDHKILEHRIFPRAPPPEDVYDGDEGSKPYEYSAYMQ